MIQEERNEATGRRADGGSYWLGSDRSGGSKDSPSIQITRPYGVGKVWIPPALHGQIGQTQCFTFDMAEVPVPQSQAPAANLTEKSTGKRKAETR